METITSRAGNHQVVDGANHYLTQAREEAKGHCRKREPSQTARQGHRHNALHFDSSRRRQALSYYLI
jgi:hypothetical protein